MARINYASESLNPDTSRSSGIQGWRDFGDTIAGRIVSARIAGYYPSGLGYRDIQVDDLGVVQIAGAVTVSGGGGGGPATIADGADVAQGATTDAANANTVVGQLKGINSKVGGTLAVSLAANTPDVTDRAARLLGHVTVDNASLAVTGTFWQATQPVSIAAAVDVSDRAARLLGVVYGSQAQQLKQTATNFNLQAELAVGATLIDPRAIRALTAADVVTVVSDTQGPGAAAGTSWRVKGDQARASATVADPVIVGGRAVNYPTKAASVTAGQVVDFALDLEGAVYVRPRTVTTYTAIYRLALAAASSAASVTFVANTDKQLATLYHAVGATKRLVLRRVWVEIISSTVAGEVQLELRELTGATAPATGNPAITPKSRLVGGGAAEATALALPTTAGTETNTNAPLAATILNLGITTAQTAQPIAPGRIVLYDEASADDEEQAPTVPAATAGGWAVVGRSTAATTVKFIIRMVFTEE